MSIALVSWSYFDKFAWHWPMKFKQSVFTCSNRNLGEVLSLSSVRSSRASQIFYYIFKIYNNFVRNEGPSFLLFTLFSWAAREALHFIKIRSVQYCIHCFIFYMFTHLHCCICNKIKASSHTSLYNAISMLLVLLFYQ